MKSVYLDTHAAVFLHDGLVEEFSTEAKRGIEANELLISPIVLLEFDYLFQRKRIGVAAKALYETLHSDFGVTVCRLAFARIVDEALAVTWTADPFDRLIVAQAKANRDSGLVTRDRVIRQHYPNAVW